MLRIELSFSNSTLLWFGTQTTSAQQGAPTFPESFTQHFTLLKTFSGLLSRWVGQSAKSPLPMRSPIILEAIDTRCHSLLGQSSEMWWPHQGAFTAWPGGKAGVETGNLRHLQFDWIDVIILIIDQCSISFMNCCGSSFVWWNWGDSQSLTVGYLRMRRHNPALPIHWFHREELHL